MGVAFWTNSNQKGSSASYSGPCGRASTVIPDAPMNGVDSLETYDNGWVVIYSENNYKGDWNKIRPNTTLNDLNKEIRGQHGDWKNQVQSFVMYNSEPSFWNDPNSGGPALEVHGEAVTLFENDDWGGNNVTLFGDQLVGDLGSVEAASNPLNSIGNIDGIATGDQSYVCVFNQENFWGDYKLFGPNTRESDLNTVPRSSGGDWKSQVRSFWQTSQNPTCWNPKFDLATFFNGYPGAENHSDNIEYGTQDATYRIHEPVFNYPTPDTMLGRITVDNELSMATDDEMTVDVTVDDTGTILEVACNIQTGGTDFRFPPFTAKAIQNVVEFPLFISALEKIGFTEPVAFAAFMTLKAAILVFNGVSKAISAYSENSDSTFYLTPVACHTVCRYLNAINPASAATHMYFDHITFAANLPSSGEIQITSGFPAAPDLNSSIEYQMNGAQFRTWYQEVTVSKEDAIMIVSCKIDVERNNTSDDHLILLAAFSRVPVPGGGQDDYTVEMVCAQATAQFGGDSASNFVCDPVYSSEYDDIAAQVAYLLGQYAGNIPSDQYRSAMPQIASLNLKAMMAAAHK